MNELPVSLFEFKSILVIMMVGKNAGAESRNDYIQD